MLAKKLAGNLVGRRMNPLSPSGAELTSRGPMFPGASQGTVTNSTTIDGLLRRQLEGKFSPDPGIRYGDGSFYLPTVDEVKFILEASQLDRRTWVAERFDCDDFSYVLKDEMSAHAYDTGALKFGLCVGMVWGNFEWVQGYHAVNWFIDSENTLHFIEPQTDQIYDTSKCRGGISLLLALPRTQRRLAPLGPRCATLRAARRARASAACRRGRPGGVAETGGSAGADARRGVAGGRERRSSKRPRHRSPAGEETGA
jgi:hypothetical protein